MGIFIAILVFGVIIVIHELGHFIAARCCGIMVEEFAIGMGPKLFGVKVGETVFSLRLFPIGGSCMMLGEEPGADGEVDEALRGRSFMSKSVPKRVLVISAGIIMNLLLALAVSFAIFSASRFVLPAVQEVVPGSPAEAAGLLPGDRIVGVNGKGVLIRDDIDRALAGNEDETVTLKVSRAGGDTEINITPRYDEEQQGYRMGFMYQLRNGPFSDATPEELETYPRAGFIETVRASFNFCVFSVREIYAGIGKLVTREVSVKEMSGPIGITSFISETYEQSVASEDPWQALWDILTLVVLISANLAVFNFLPIPMLDGGRLIFLLIEAVRGKPIKPEREGMINFAGFVLVIILAVFVAYNDILKLI